MTLPLWKMIEDMLGQIDVTDMEVKEYKCPECGKAYNLVEVRKITDNGEFPVCTDCGELLQADDGE